MQKWPEAILCSGKESDLEEAMGFQQEKSLYNGPSENQGQGRGRGLGEWQFKEIQLEGTIRGSAKISYYNVHEKSQLKHLPGSESKKSAYSNTNSRKQLSYSSFCFQLPMLQPRESKKPQLMSRVGRAEESDWTKTSV